MAIQGLIKLRETHPEFQAIVTFPPIDQLWQLHDVYRELPRKLFLSLCCGRLEPLQLRTQDIDSKLTLVDLSGVETEDNKITRGVPAHLLKRVVGGKSEWVDDPPVPTRETMVWTYEGADRSWYLTVVSQLATRYIELVGNVGCLADLWVPVPEEYIKAAAREREKEKEKAQRKQECRRQRKEAREMKQRMAELEESLICILLRDGGRMMLNSTQLP